MEPIYSRQRHEIDPWHIGNNPHNWTKYLRWGYIVLSDSLFIALLVSPDIDSSLVLKISRTHFSRSLVIQEVNEKSFAFGL
jgi:hypothetical protein